MSYVVNAVDMHSNYNSYMMNQKNEYAVRQISSNDSVAIEARGEFYEKLKTWTKGENGESKLVSLKDVPTGAIYLASNESRDRLIDTEKLEDGSVTLKDRSGATGKHIDMML